MPTTGSEASVGTSRSTGYDLTITSSSFPSLGALLEEPLTGKFSDGVTSSSGRSSVAAELVEVVSRMAAG